MEGESERGFSYEVLLVNHIALSTAVGGSQMLLRLFFTTRDVTQLLHQVVVPSYAILPTGSHLSVALKTRSNPASNRNHH